MPTFAENLAVLDDLRHLRDAVLALSRSGYVVQRFTSKASRPVIQIDRALDRVSPEILEHRGRRIASCDFLFCRVYWFVTDDIGA